MGAKSSKPVAQAKHATRKFPSRPVGRSVPPSSRPAPTVSSSEPSSQAQSAAPAAAPSQRPSAQQASFTKDDVIKADGMDPSAPASPATTFTDPNHHTNAAFAQRLRQMGIATPNPTLSNSSIVNNGPGPTPPPPPSKNPSATSTYSGLNPTTTTSPSPTTTSAASSRASRPIPARGGDTMSGASRGNSTTLNALHVRAELTQNAQLEFDKGNRDREFLDVNTLRQLVVLLEARQKQGGGGGKGSMTDAEIERKLNLRAGVVKRLGERPGVFGTLSI